MLHAAPPTVAVWMTTADKKQLLTEQPEKLAFGPARQTAAEVVTIDDSRSFQTMDGFGHALTGGSAYLLMKMSPSARHALLVDLFGTGKDSIATSYIRVTVGASDMNDHVYTYDDLPEGQVDPELKHFSLSEDMNDVVPVLKEILAINPHIHILASPWTPPVWMKSNGKAKDGVLKHEYYPVYAHYFVRYVEAMRAQGIHIEAITPQNEPENPHNTPSLVMTSPEEADFIGNHLGPALAAAKLDTRIISFDHNCDHPEYPLGILKDAKANAYTDGSGFHLYLGEIGALTTVHNAFPNKNIYFTEQMVVPWKDDEGFAIANPVNRLIIDAPNNWSRNVLLWNLAADPKNGPHTNDGGCPMCSGAITIDGDTATRNLAYYTAAHASKFVPSGSVRIASPGDAGSLPHVAFRTPDHRHVLIVSNPSHTTHHFTLRYEGRDAEAELAGGAVATYVW